MMRLSHAHGADCAAHSSAAAQLGRAADAARRIVIDRRTHELDAHLKTPAFRAFPERGFYGRPPRKLTGVREIR